MEIIIRGDTVDELRQNILDIAATYKIPKSNRKHMRGKVSPYHNLWSKVFKELYDNIDCGGRPLRGSGHRLTREEYTKVVREAHAITKERMKQT